MAHIVRDGERNQSKLAFDEISEEPIQVQEGNDKLNKAICDVCFIRTLRSVAENIALYLCYMCDKYLCQDCFIEHESHQFIKKGEKDGQIEKFLDEMMNEIERGKMFEREDVSMVDRVNVKHELDQTKCGIYGLCGLNNARWVVCDYYNRCIKIFSVGSNILQRYIRFGTHPWGIVEIQVKRKPIEQDIMSASEFSITNKAVPDKQCLLAVTLLFVRRILFIDVTQNHAIITKTIKTEKRCYSIDFSEDNIVTLCSDYVEERYHWFVSLMSTDGVTIKTININLNTSWGYPYIAVCPGRFFVSDLGNDKVLCLNDEGKVVSHKTIERSWPEGISVDPDTNKVYICARGLDKLYRLDSSFESFEYLFDFKSVNLQTPLALCLYRDRLYVGHGPGSTHESFVNVLRVL